MFVYSFKHFTKKKGGRHAAKRCTKCVGRLSDRIKLLISSAAQLQATWYDFETHRLQRAHLGAPDHDFFIPLLIKTLLLSTSTGLQTVVFVHTPLDENATFDLERGAPDRDFFIPLSIKKILLTSSTGLRTVTFLYQIGRAHV